MAGEIDRATFNRVYDEAIGDGEGHPFLLVDFAKRKEHPSILSEAAERVYRAVKEGSVTTFLSGSRS